MEVELPLNLLNDCSRHFRDIVSLKQRAVNLVAADVTFLTRPMPRAVISVAELHRARLR